MTDDASSATPRPAVVHRFFVYFSALSPGDRLLLGTALFVCAAAGVWALVAFSNAHRVEVSTRGGSIVEGVVGTPRFLNPVLAITRADRDLNALIYAGLLRRGNEGALVPDIAHTITLSNDGRTYGIVLRSDVTFHDGTPLTAQDVAFTIARIQDPAAASALRSNFEGVTVEVLGTHELSVTLEEAYRPFVENLTVGILPEHIWSLASSEEFPFSQHNSEPIGAGPYRVNNIVRTTSGIPSAYTLVPHTGYHNGRANIGSITMRFYPSETRLIAAFNRGEVESMSRVSPLSLSAATIQHETHRIATSTLPRTFAVFFNQNRSTALRDEAARRALDRSVDRVALIGEVLDGYGTPLGGPVPPGFGEYTDAVAASLDEARGILRENGWEMNEEAGVWEKDIAGATTPLALSIATENHPLFEAVAEVLAATWHALGAEVTVRQFERSDFTQAIVRPRAYEALLFGTEVGRPLDFYSFWHSSQRNDPGLNVALYASITADALLEHLRTSTSTTDRADTLRAFEEEIAADVPALFLFSPHFIYVHPTAVTGVQLSGMASADERLSNVHEWFISTEQVWPFFAAHTHAAH